MVDYNYVRMRRDEAIGVLTIDNPPVNLLNFQLLKELERAVDELDLDSAVRGIVITGAGNYAFSAGVDIKSIEEIKPEQAADVVRLGQRVFNRVEDCAKPVIAAVNGLALGGGCELSLACDMRIASERARFGLPEVTLGLMPGWGGTYRLPRIVGRAKSKELILTGIQITAQEAYRIGFVNRVVPDGEELRAASDIVRQIAARCAPLAVSAAKKAIDEGLAKPSREEALGVELQAILSITGSEDLREGIDALLSKRQPLFKGR